MTDPEIITLAKIREALGIGHKPMPSGFAGHLQANQT